MYSWLYKACVISIVMIPSVKSLEFDDVMASLPKNMQADKGVAALPSMVIDGTDTMEKLNKTHGYVIGTTKKLNASDFIITPCKPKVWTITEPKASSMWFHFDSIQLPGDKLIISTMNYTEKQIYTLTTNGITTDPISGNAIRMEYLPSQLGYGCSAQGLGGGNKDGYGIQLSTLHYTYDNSMMVKKETICGDPTPEFTNVECYKNDQFKYSRTRPILRSMMTSPNGETIVLCTVWLWGKSGHLLTNNHCFVDQTSVDAAKFQFDVRNPTCEGDCDVGRCPVGETVLGKGNIRYIRSSPDLDFSILQFERDGEKYAKKYGYLRLRAKEAVVGEKIFIPQQPMGSGMKIATGPDAKITDTNISLKVEGTSYSGLLGYYLDTEGGSSGSPLISDTDGSVVGLHRIGNCPNGATPGHILLEALIDIAVTNDGAA